MAALLPPPAVLDLLRSLSDGAPLVVFDLETTGTDRLADRIVEFAALRIPKEGEPAVLELRVNPGVRIPREATAVHGISDADVALAPPFAQVAPRIAAFLEGADVAGYNVRAFDLPLLAREFERAKVPFSLEGRRVLDAQSLFFKKEPRDLSAAVRIFAGREHEGAHSALADVVASAEVLAGELERYPDLPRDVEGLHAYSQPSESRWVDPDKRFLWRDGEAVFGFGAKKGKALAEVAARHPDYLEWMLGADFPDEAKRIVRDALRGVFPARAG